MAHKYYKTIITVEVLSEVPLAEDADLERVLYEITDGAWSGVVKIGDSKRITQKQVEKELVKQGSDPEFFNSGIR